MPPEDEHGGIGLELGGAVELHLALGGLATELKHQRQMTERRRQALIEAQQRPVPITGSATSGSGGTLAFSCQGPARGYVWLLRRIWVGGSLITDTPGGTAYLFGRPNDPSKDLSPTNLVDDFTHQALPQIGYYSNEQVTLQAGEQLWVYITPADDDTQYVAAGQVQQFTIDAYQELFTL